MCGRSQKTKLKNMQPIASVKMAVSSFLIKNLFVKKRFITFTGHNLWFPSLLIQLTFLLIMGKDCPTLKLD